jgi:transcriptional regulator with XRE-family HTH domain
MINMDTIKQRLGKNVSGLRLQKGWSQARLAEMISISPTFMMHIERGSRGSSLETVELLADAFGVDVAILFMERQDERGLTEQQRLLFDHLENDLKTRVIDAIRWSLDGMKQRLV